MPLNFSYDSSKEFCQHIGLVWRGDDYRPLVDMDRSAEQFGLTQEQVSEGMRHHLWHIKCLFTPSYYKWPHRIAMAFYFLTGWKPK